MTPEPKDRAVIIVLTETERVRCEWDDGGADLLNAPGTWVVSTDMQDDPLLASLAASGRLVPGNILARSPYDDDMYHFAAEARDAAAIRKHLIFAELCRLLGASYFKMSVVEKHDEQGIREIKAGGRRGPLRGNASVRKTREQALAAQLQMEDRYATERLPDVVAARRLLAATNLVRDPLMNSCVAARTDGNLLTSRTYELDLTHESRNQTVVTAKLAVPAFANLDIHGLDELRTQIRYTAKYYVEF